MGSAMDDSEGGALCQLVGTILADVDQFEQAHHLRVRARRAADRESREDLVHALVVNLAHASLCPPPHADRLAARATTGEWTMRQSSIRQSVRPLLNHMHEMGLLEFRLATRGEIYSLAPTAEFASRVRDLEITLADFGHDEREEVLILTRRVETRSAKGTESINYRETSETKALGNAVRKVNAFLASADIEFIDDGLSPHVDLYDRRSKRRFVLPLGKYAERFDLGGRLLGGFWTNPTSAVCVGKNFLGSGFALVAAVDRGRMGAVGEDIGCEGWERSRKRECSANPWGCRGAEVDANL